MTRDTRDYMEAMELKRRNLPSSLFRYRSWSKNTLREIETDSIFLSPPDKFNDIFDSWLGCGWRTLVEESKEDVRKKIQERYTDPSELQKIMDTDNWVRNLIFDTGEREGRNSEAVYQAFQTALEKGAELVETQFNKVLRKTVRIACFTTKHDNLPLWYHYAKDYSEKTKCIDYAGVCLEYEISHGKVAPIFIDSLFPVSYQLQMPDMIQLVKNYPFQAFKYPAMLKNVDWAYEDEWRLILTLGDVYLSPENIPESAWEDGMEYHFLPVKAVYMGNQIMTSHSEYSGGLVPPIRDRIPANRAMIPMCFQ